MNLFRWFERRASVTTLATPSPTFWELFSSGPTESGQVVDATTALKVPAVFACVQVLSQDVARTPTKLRQQTAPDTYVDAVDHPLYELLNVLPNPEQTAYQFKHTLMWQLLTYGRAYAEIVRIDGRITALWPLDSASMRVDRDPQRRKRWTYTAGAQTLVWTFDASQPPILELTHESPMLRCRDLIGTSLGLQQYIAKFFANNGKPAGVLQAPGAISDTTATRLRDYWAQNYAGSKNAFKVPVLDAGLEFKPISMDHDSAQMAETWKALATAICGAFRVPPWKAGLMESTNYSNMESGEMSYITSTLDPYFESWEEAMRRDLLTARQFNTYTVHFDRQALVRNDVRNLHTSLSSGIQNGYLSQNDARAALGLNPIPNGDVYLVNSALQPVGTPKAVPNVA